MTPGHASRRRLAAKPPLAAVLAVALTVGTAAACSATSPAPTSAGSSAPARAAAEHGDPHGDPSSTPCGPTDRGRLLSSTPTARLAPAQVAAALSSAHLPGTARYGVDEYRLRYCTVSPRQSPTVASGLLAVPAGAPGVLPLVGYEHSTVTARADVPSAHATGDGLLAPPFFATDGFAVAAPDYLGLGDSPGPHPFMHAASEASATLDLLPAADRAATDVGAHLSHDLLLTGHSQGGAAAMAAGQALQRDHGPWHVRALAPMAGPYDLAHSELPAITDPRAVDPHHASAYLAYLLTAWSTLYHPDPVPGPVFAPGVQDTVADLLDGTHGFTEVAAALPPPRQLLRPGALAALAHPTGPLAAALEADAVCRWAPRAPTRLYAGHADRDVVFANSQACRAQIRASGGDATVEDVGQVGHIETAIVALPAIRTWFTTLATAAGPTGTARGR